MRVKAEDAIENTVRVIPRTASAVGAHGQEKRVIPTNLVATNVRDWEPAMPLPDGTVTFLFTDIEGSTRLWEEHPEAMRPALARHDALLRKAVGDNDGVVFKTVGDAFCAVFSTAPDAVAAALLAQQQLASEPWDDELGGVLRVRMAIHTGAAQLRDADYFGPPLNRAARLLTTGHGGQTLLSQPTYDLVRDYLPAGVDVRDLDLHRLKDLQRPEHVYQLLHPALPADFPKLKSLDPLTNNLPIQATSFVGREKEIREVKELLKKTRLLTLTGSGGAGKTRLSLQVAADLTEVGGDAVWLAEFAPLGDPGLVPQIVAQALGVREEPGRPITQTLVDFLTPRSLLLVLDNCEHVLDAAATLCEAILRACQNVKIIASSREGLNIAGETTYRVPSLSVPDPKQAATPESLSQFEAVHLFIERAQAAQPGFAVTSQNAPAVAQLCHRLDGIPYAIELAAAKVRALSVEQISARMDDRFRLLTGGNRTALPRQQTLRAMIDWSYDLLSPEEQTLLRRLSVFAGGWTLEAAEAVCADPDPDPDEDQRAVTLVNPDEKTCPFCGETIKAIAIRCRYCHADLTGTALAPAVASVAPAAAAPAVPAPAPLDAKQVQDLLTHLIDKSLAVYEENEQGQGRYRLLETVRQYARERLGKAGEVEAVRGRHLGWFLALAEKAQPELFGPEQRAWMDRLEEEHDNLRATLEWSGAQEWGAAGLRLGTALWRFWSVRGYLTEGRERLRSVLSHPGASSPTAERTRALDGAGLLAMNCGDFTGATVLYEEALSIGQELGDGRVIAMVCNSLGDARRFQGDGRAARLLYEEAVRSGREVDDAWNVAYALTGLAIMSGEEGSFAAARSLFAEGLAIKRVLGDKRSVAYSVFQLAGLALAEENTSEARSLYQESLTISRELSDKRWIALSLRNLGALDRAEGDLPGARARLAESAAIFAELGDKSAAAKSLQAVAEMAAAQT